MNEAGQVVGWAETASNGFDAELNPSPIEPTAGASLALSLSQSTFTGRRDDAVVLTATDQDGLSGAAETVVRVVAPAVAEVSPSTINQRSRGRYLTV